MEELEKKIRKSINEITDNTVYLNEEWENKLTERIMADIKAIQVQALVSPMLANVEEMQKELGILKTENEKLKFMINNGLGWEDMINDISYPPRD